MVSLPDAAPGRAAGQRDFYIEELVSVGIFRRRFPRMNADKTKSRSGREFRE
jgi:hypothetical protein